MSHRGGPDHADVTSSWFGSLALLVLLCRVWRMDPLSFSGRGPGCTFPPLHSGWGAGPPAPSDWGAGPLALVYRGRGTPHPISRGRRGGGCEKGGGGGGGARG